MKRSSLTPTLAICAAFTFAAALTATAHNGEDHAGPVGERHKQMETISANTKILGGMAQGKVAYDADAATAAAQALNAAATMDIDALWPAGTAQGEVPGSRAKAEVWSDRDGFVKAFQTLADASAAMIPLAAQGPEAIGGGMGAIGGSCKACHTDYRGPKN